MLAEKEKFEASEDSSLIAKALGSTSTLPKPEECPIGDSSGWFSFGKISVQAPRLLLYREIPSWQCDNEYILSGYRPTSSSTLGCLSSLLYIHNETISIWSHLIGSALFYSLPYFFWSKIYHRLPNAGRADFTAFSIFFVSVATCFLLSSICHIIWNHSPSYASTGNKLDYLGIILLMWGAAIPSIYYGLSCDPFLQRLYWTMITIVALCCAIFTCTPRFCTPRFRKYRATMYAGLGLTGVVFAAHGVVERGWEVQNQRMALDWMMVMASFNFMGAGLYAARVPERFFPYTFDIYGGSHQFFHIMVIFAGLAHFAGLLKAFDYVKAVGHTCATQSH